MAQNERSEPERELAPDPAVLENLLAARREFLSFLERRIGNRATAEDLLQDAFAKATRRAGEIRKAESAVAWFYRLLRNAIVDHHRSAGAEDRALTLLANDLTEGSPGPEAERAVCRCVTKLASSMKPEYADALQRVEVEGAAVKDYASERGISASNAGVRIHRARNALRELVVLSCRACAEHGCIDCDCA
jgi:RNA polymerase sigma factor (sigma-70 family)